MPPICVLYVLRYLSFCIVAVVFHQNPKRLGGVVINGFLFLFIYFDQDEN